jgi:23S rRNA (uracil-5-)-methyltransferase RumA
MELTVDIIDLDHNGRGIGKINNKVIFIPNALPGEKVKVKILKDKKNYAEGVLLELINKSNTRIGSPCKYYPKCGGCQLLHLKYEDQLIYKENKIKNIFKKYNLEEVKINNIVYKNKQFNYRNKVTLHRQNNKIGYFEENTNTIVEIDNCMLLDKKINDSLKNVPSNNKIVIRSNGIDISHNNSEKVMHTIVDYKFSVSNDSFFQVNDNVTELLYSKVLEYLEPTKNDTVLDLYCGTGTIGIFISNHVKNVIGIELNKVAIKNAKENKELNKINNIEFICGDAGLESKKLIIPPDSIIVDPPRSGLDSEAINTILNLNPKKIVYVSCDPMTLIRDLKVLSENYNIIELTPFDMFPNTYHVECVCNLVLK